METILISSSTAHTRTALRDLLVNHDYLVASVDNHQGIFDLLQSQKIDLLVLDVAKDEEDAISLCLGLRSQTVVSYKPILLLTSKIDANHAAALLDSGADDLLRKPFVNNEFLARIRALLRLISRIAYDRPFALEWDDVKKIVYVDQREISLTPIEFQLLKYLCTHNDRYFTAEDLLQELWEYPPETGDTALVRNHIRNLRRKLEDDPDRPRILVSRYGQGYSVNAVVQES